MAPAATSIASSAGVESPLCLYASSMLALYFSTCCSNARISSRSDATRASRSTTSLLRPYLSPSAAADSDSVVMEVSFPEKDTASISPSDYDETAAVCIPCTASPMEC